MEVQVAHVDATLSFEHFYGMVRLLNEVDRSFCTLPPQTPLDYTSAFKSIGVGLNPQLKP